MKEYRCPHRRASQVGLLRQLALILLSLHVLSTSAAPLRAIDFEETQRLYWGGQYAACQEQAAAEVERGVFNERWAMLLMRCQLTTGQYAAALPIYEATAERYRTSIEVRLLGYDVYRYNNQPDRAAATLDEIIDLASNAPYRYTSRANLVALGRCFLLQHEDARKILELFYDRALRDDPAYVDAHIASAELALQKHDYQVAVTALTKAAKLSEANPDIPFMLAVALESTDSAAAATALLQALELNPQHLPSLLMRADNQIDAESYEQAETTLAQVLEVNPRHPQAWAYRAVIAHLQGQYDQEMELRSRALQSWETNPEVDYWIGRKLSQKYRFAEGVEYQRRALAFDPQHAPAKFQLGQDLLRLGKDDEGWRVTQDVHNADAYNVVAYNLMNLHDRMRQYATIERDGLVLRMARNEAETYGQAAADLLSEARSALCEKYAVTLDGPVTVEIFPQQKDFAVRTFGMPGGEGFLGVCFGRVITANSPASQGESPSNWQAVLWHEFCHVVTLEKTRNRMPRWLSEGISVYEERQRDPSWGEQLGPQYREMMLGDALTPVSQLSGAFLRPDTPLHLQFAYYEASLVVEYLVERHGHESLLRILDDLAVGMPIHETLERHIGPPAIVDEQFAEYAKARANALAPELDWSQDDLPERASADDWSTWLESHPNNYWALRQTTARLVAAEQWDAARPLLDRLQQHYPDDVSGGNSLELLAKLHRAEGDAGAERSVLEQLGELDDEAVDTYMRILELATADEDWATVKRFADRLLAVQPLLPVGHQMLTRSAEATGDYQAMIRPLEALLAMAPVDPAQLHFQLASAYEQLDQRDQARRHVLYCLAEAPRYRAAQQLLIRLHQGAVTASETESVPEAASESESGDALEPEDEPAQGADAPDDEEHVDTVPERSETEAVVED